MRWPRPEGWRQGGSQGLDGRNQEALSLAPVGASDSTTWPTVSAPSEVRRHTDGAENCWRIVREVTHRKSTLPAALVSFVRSWSIATWVFVLWTIAIILAQ